MLIIRHRVNTVLGLKEIPADCGVEIDIRGDRGRLVLNHDPLEAGKEYEDLDAFLAVFAARELPFVILNIKETGVEKSAMELCAKHGIGPERFALLDVEYPYLYKATRKLVPPVHSIFVRYSEAEPIEAVLAQMKDGQPLVDWVWIDVPTKLPLDADTVAKLKPFKTCVVCPHCWGRPEDIDAYCEQMKALGFVPDAVMTDQPNEGAWRAHFS